MTLSHAPITSISKFQKTTIVSFQEVKAPGNSEGFLGPCVEFETIAEIKNGAGESLVNFTVIYDISEVGINMTVSNLTTVFEDFTYYFGPLNEVGFCVGTREASDSNCSIEFPDGDFQYDMIFSFSNSADSGNSIQGNIVGELARRNGIFVRSGNQVYTNESTCWIRSGEVAITHQTSDSSFCCTAFEDNPPVITTTAISSSTDGKTGNDISTTTKVSREFFGNLRFWVS